MYLTTKVKIVNPNTELLDNLGFIVTKFYNTANYERRNQWKLTGKIPNYFEQCVKLKDNHWAKKLHSQTAQSILGCLDESYKSWYQLRKTDKDANPPGFRKKSAISSIPFKKSAIKIQDHTIQLSLGNEQPDRYYTFEYQSLIKITQNNVIKLELVKTKKGKWLAHIVYIVYKAEPKPQKQEGGIKAIDLGIVHFATTINNDGTAKIYTGKGGLSIQRYFNKTIAKVQSKVSLQGKKWSNRLTELSQKKTRQINHLIHSTTKAIIDDCLKENIKTIVIGDLRNIRKQKGKSTNHGKKNNQKLHAWSFNKFTSQLRYKAILEGISLIEIGERETSKTCSQCGYVESYKGQCRKHRGLYICKNCGIKINADINGATNILNKYLQEFNGSRSSGFLATPSVSKWNFHKLT